VYKSKLSFAKHLAACLHGVLPPGKEPDLSLECKICLRVLSSQATFENHMDCHRQKTNLEVPIGCPACHKVIESKMLLNEHFRVSVVLLILSGTLWTHSFLNFFCALQTQHDLEKAVCTECLFITSATLLERHMKKKHFVKKHLCPICGKEFNMLLRMQIHMSTVHDRGSSSVICDQVICNSVKSAHFIVKHPISLLKCHHYFTTPSSSNDLN
jgi:hypothetical protein